MIRESNVENGVVFAARLSFTDLHFKRPVAGSTFREETSPAAELGDRCGKLYAALRRVAFDSRHLSAITAVTDRLPARMQGRRRESHTGKLHLFLWRPDEVAKGGRLRRSILRGC